MISVGHSIVNRTSAVDVVSLVLQYGGGHTGRHRQVKYEDLERIIVEMLEVINAR